MPAKWFLEIRSRVPRKAALALGLVPVLLLLAAWWLVTLGPPEERLVGISVLPSPVEVARSLPELVSRRDLFSNILASLRRVALGYLIALVVVLPLGIAMGSFGTAAATLAPVSTASGYIPIATLVPLTMSWFGTGETMKVMFLAMAFGISLLPLVVKAVDAVPDVYLRTAFTLGATRLQVVRHVLIPIALPDIWHAMRLSFAVGWTYLVLAEAIVLDNGLGFLVQMSQRRGPREHIYLVIIVISLIAWVADQAWVRIGQLLFPYKRRGS